MSIYEANKEIEIIKNKLKYLYEKKQMAFESTQPKGMSMNDISVQSSHSSDGYARLDYSIDEIEPKIKQLEKELDLLQKYVDGYYDILNKYDPLAKKIIQLREETKLTWQKISEACNYSEKQCRNIYKKYKNLT